MQPQLLLDYEKWRPVNIDGLESFYEASNYGQVRNSMTNEVLKSVPGFNGRLKATTDGRIWDEKFQRWAPQYNRQKTKNGNPYLCVCIDRKMYSVHRLVALAYIPNPNNYPFINHKDEDPTNNQVSNLEWCTPKHNSNWGTLPVRQRLYHKDQRKRVCAFRDGETEAYLCFCSICDAVKYLEDVEKKKVILRNISQVLNKTMVKSCDGKYRLRKKAYGYH